MPSDLVKAHLALDNAVKRYLSIPSESGEELIVSHLTDLHLEMLALGK